MFSCWFGYFSNINDVQIFLNSLKNRTPLFLFKNIYTLYLKITIYYFIYFVDKWSTFSVVCVVRGDTEKWIYYFTNNYFSTLHSCLNIYNICCQTKVSANVFNIIDEKDGARWSNSYNSLTFCG